MLNGMMTAAANPLDMILGLGGAKSAGGEGGESDFSMMLGLSPHAVVPGQASLEGFATGKVASVPSDADLVGRTTVLIPLNLLESAGLSTPISSDAIPQPLSSNVPEPKLMFSAELMVADDGSDTIYLKLEMEKPGGTVAVDLPLVEGNDREMILPVRLRTVEQAGNRLIVDAELLGAAGKDTPIRLKLELTGTANGSMDLNQRLSANALMSSDNRAFAAKPGNLPRMLGELGVKTIVIENVENGSTSTLQSLLPDAAPLFKKSAGLTTARPDGAFKPSSAESIVTGQKTDAVGMTSTSISEGRFEAVVREKAEKGQILSVKTGNENVPGDKSFGLFSTVTAEESGAIAASANLTESVSTSTETKSETAPVKFYDLDQRLDQLKRNPGQKINIQLSPARLGKMELSISSHRGIVTVNLILESTQARQMVERSLPQLESQLAASGIKVDNLQVTVNQSSKNENFTGNYFHQHGGDQSGYHGRQGGNRRQYFARNRLQDFNMAGVDFNQVLVNCQA